jgi:hypothetical protein
MPFDQILLAHSEQTLESYKSKFIDIIDRDMQVIENLKIRRQK